MGFLATRSQQNELMDNPNIGFEEFQQTLSEIEKINQKTGSYRSTFKFLNHLISNRHLQEPIRILDIGFGNGDFLRRIYAWAKKREIKVELSGVDLNPWSKKAAEAANIDSFPIQYFTSNIFDFKTEKPCHLMINSFFTHHLSNEEIIQVMQWMTERALWGWFINDLHRHYLPYYFIRFYVRLLGYNRLVRHDAPLSVARSFTRKDWKDLIKLSGLEKSHLNLSWHWPFRYGVSYATPTNF